MATKFRKIPPVCLIISIIRLIFRKLRYSKQYLGKIVKMGNEQEFHVFRYIAKYSPSENKTATTFIVSFKFAHLSHRANKIASIIPMLLITGFPGFETKIYAVNHKNGYWQGMYQWKSKEALDEYKKSFVFKMMNKRAINESIHSISFENMQLIDYLRNKSPIT